jgi:hypothetical protein
VRSLQVDAAPFQLAARLFLDLAADARAPALARPGMDSCMICGCTSISLRRWGPVELGHRPQLGGLQTLRIEPAISSSSSARR